MLVDVIRHQHAHVRAALEALASLVASVAERVERAQREIEEAFRAGVPVWAAHHVATIQSLVGGAEGRPVDLAANDLATLTAAFVELYTLACREYWTA